jgi:hypothetical protein
MINFRAWPGGSGLRTAIKVIVCWKWGSDQENRLTVLIDSYYSHPISGWGKFT